jgi:hypothetical protein
MSEESKGTMGNILNIVLIVITITVILLVSPLSVTVSRIDNKDIPDLRTRQTQLELSVKETQIRYETIEKLLTKIGSDLDYIRKEVGK